MHAMYLHAAFTFSLVFRGHTHQLQDVILNGQQNTRFHGSNSNSEYTENATRAISDRYGRVKQR
jgi:hypothetical protein